MMPSRRAHDASSNINRRAIPLITSVAVPRRTITPRCDTALSFIYMRTRLCLLLLLVWAAALGQAAPPRLPREQQSLWNAYFRSVYDSAVYERVNVRELFPLRADHDGNVRVATLGRRDGNVGDPILSSGEGIWVTVVPEVQTICRQFTGDVPMQLRELLGLPPDADVPRFLILQARAADI